MGRRSLMPSKVRLERAVRLGNDLGTVDAPFPGVAEGCRCEPHEIVLAIAGQEPTMQPDLPQS